MSVVGLILVSVLAGFCFAGLAVLAWLLDGKRQWRWVAWVSLGMALLLQSWWVVMFVAAAYKGWVLGQDT